MDTLTYSRGGVFRFLLLINGVSFVVIGTFILHGSMPQLFPEFGPVGGAVAMSVGAYALAVITVRSLLLLGNGGVAFKALDSGLTVHTLWTKRNFEWREVSIVELERIETRGGHHYNVRAVFGSGMWAVSARARGTELQGMLADFGQWVDRAEALRIAHGGQPRQFSSILLIAWLQKNKLAQVAWDRARSHL